MSDSIVTVTLEFNVQATPSADMDIICEAMMVGAVNGISSNATGTGFDYSYTKKKSRRGMTVTKKKDAGK